MTTTPPHDYDPLAQTCRRCGLSRSAAADAGIDLGCWAISFFLGARQMGSQHSFNVAATSRGNAVDLLFDAHPEALGPFGIAPGSDQGVGHKSL